MLFVFTESTPTHPPMQDSEFQDLVQVFRALSTRNAYRRVLQVNIWHYWYWEYRADIHTNSVLYHIQKLHKPEVLENIISTTPGLSEDYTAIVILQHPELLAKLGDANAVKRYLIGLHRSIWKKFRIKNLVFFPLSE